MRVTLPIFLFFVFLNASLLLKYPDIWPDEAIYADIANNLSTENRLGTTLWQGLIPNVESYAFWYPPVFFYILAFWEKLFDLSIFSQRFFSLLIGSFVVFLFYFFSKIFFKKNSLWFILLFLFMLVTDFNFLRAVRISRPEIFVLFFGIISFLFYIKNKKSIGLSIAGFFSSLAALTHIIALFIPLSIALHFLIINKLNSFKSKYFYIFLFSFLVPIIIWLTSIYPHIDILKEQILLAVIRKNIDQTWLLYVFSSNQPFLIKILNFDYLFFALIFVIFAFIYRKNKNYLFLTIIIVLSFSFAIFSKQFWYYLYPIPFVYLGITLLLLQNLKKIYKHILVTFILILILTNIALQSLIIFDGWEKSYENYTLEILKIIPENKTVFLSSIPDPYYAFKTKDRNNKLYEFPVLHTKKENYLNVLNNSDYIIYNGSYDAPIFGDFLENYIKKNGLNFYKVGELSGYKTLIIELKPKKERIKKF